MPTSSFFPRNSAKRAKELGQPKYVPLLRGLDFCSFVTPMMLLISIFFASVIHFTASLPTYAIPKPYTLDFLMAAGCVLPESFIIQNVQIWTPAAGNNQSQTISFGYFDNSTSIQTSCQYNSSSENVGKPGLAPRFACDNPVVEFIWQGGALTMIEKACPE
jgi:hypothetical protein